MLGGLLALVSAATFALNNAVARRGVLTGSVVQATAITVLIGAAMFVAAVVGAGLLHEVFGFGMAGLGWLALAGLTHFIWSRYCTYRAIKAMGGNLVGPIQQVGLLLTLALSIAVLGESLTTIRILGLILVIIGPMLLLGQRKSRTAAGASGSTILAVFSPDYREGYFYAALSALGASTSPILVRLAMPEGSGIGTGIAAGFVSYLTAALAVSVWLAWPGKLRHVLDVERQSLRWFSLAGVMVCLSQMFRYMALAIAPVSVVTPIQRTAVVFRLLFARMINPDHEVFSGRIVAATFISLAGAILLSISTEWLFASLALPSDVRTALSWSWPG